MTAPAPENAIMCANWSTSPWKISRAKTGRNVSSGNPRNVVRKARIVSAMIAGWLRAYAMPPFISSRIGLLLRAA